MVFDSRGDVIGATGVTLNVDERRIAAGRAREALLEGERAARLESEQARVLAERLQLITAGLARASTRGDVGRVVIGQLVPSMNALAGGVSELDPLGERLMFVATSFASADTTFPFVRLDDAVLSRDVIMTGQPIFVANVEEFRARYPELEALRVAGGFEALATLPLLVDGRPIGSLAVIFAEPRDFPAAERQYLEIVSGLCAQSLRRAQALEAERLLAVRLARLGEISDLALARLPIDELLSELPARIAALLECDTVRILLLDESGRELVESGGTAFDAGAPPLRVPVGRGFAGRVAGASRAGGVGRPRRDRVGRPRRLASERAQRGRCSPTSRDVARCARCRQPQPASLRRRRYRSAPVGGRPDREGHRTESRRSSPSEQHANDRSSSSAPARC